MAFLFYILHSILLLQSRELFGVCILHPGSHKNIDTLLTNNDLQSTFPMRQRFANLAEQWLRDISKYFVEVFSK